MPMPKLRTLLFSVLIICTLGTSCAWAYGDHVVDFNHLEHQHDADEQAPSHESLSDHCGHLSAHIVGLLNEICFSFNVAELSAQPELTKHFLSFIPLLYLRPPSL